MRNMEGDNMQYIPKNMLIKIIADKALDYFDLDPSGHGYVSSTYMIGEALKELKIEIDYLEIEDDIENTMRGLI